MLVMKAWLETRWRLTAAFVWPLLWLAINYQNRASANPRALLLFLGALFAMLSLTLAGSGVKSQSPIGFPEGLAGSTQFTISLPVSRLRLLTVRAAIGLLEAIALTVVVGCLTWGLFPSVRASVTPGDFVRLLSTIILSLTAPYSAAVLFGTFLDEPLSFVFAGWMITLLLWLAHHIAPAVDIVRAWGQASPLVTHKLPWSQMTACVVLSVILMFAAARIVQTREY